MSPISKISEFLVKQNIWRVEGSGERIDRVENRKDWILAICSSKMAANFWLSSHCNQWLLDREEIQLERQRDYQYLKEEDYKKIHIFFINFIQALGEHLKLRQQVIATATLYYKRFYARNSLKSIDSLLMAPTCTYLAHKTEECGVISNNRFTAACNTVVKNKFSFAFPGEQFPYRMSQVSHHRN